jgi:hypothetical protein
MQADAGLKTGAAPGEIRTTDTGELSLMTA